MLDEFFFICCTVYQIVETCESTMCFCEFLSLFSVALSLLVFVSSILFLVEFQHSFCSSVSPKSDLSETWLYRIQAARVSSSQSFVEDHTISVDVEVINVTRRPPSIVDCPLTLLHCLTSSLTNTRLVWALGHKIFGVIFGRIAFRARLFRSLRLSVELAERPTRHFITTRNTSRSGSKGCPPKLNNRNRGDNNSQAGRPMAGSVSPGKPFELELGTVGDDYRTEERRKLGPAEGKHNAQVINMRLFLGDKCR